MVLALLTLSRNEPAQKPVPMSRVSFTVNERSDGHEPSPKPTPDKARTHKAPKFAAAKPTPTVQPAPTPIPSPPAAPPIIPLSRQEMAALDIAKLPVRPAAPAGPRRMMGPPAPAIGPDTARVGGSGPNGEPLYAASWYREPYDDELRGYLSTASGPGWALIACRTVPDFRVEDCVALDEYPNGSNMARAVLAAAWQFRVRPPRLGGVSKVGEWVRIKIDYEIRHK